MSKKEKKAIDASDEVMVEDEQQLDEATQEVALPEEATPVPKPPSIDDLVNSTIRDLPGLVEWYDSVEMVMTVLATYVGSAEIPILKVDRQVAFSELDLTHGWRPGDIKQACDNVMEGLADAFQVIQADFEDKTGTETESADFEAFALRFNSEREEQSKLAGNARALLRVVREVSGQLGIPNPDPGAQPDKKDDPKEWIKKVGDAFVGGGRKALSPLFEFKSQKDIESVVAPGWLTDPVIDEEDRDLKILDLVQARLGPESDVKLVWATLEKLNLDRERLTEVLERVALKARKQLEQSKEILSTAKSEYEDFERRLDSIRRTQQVILAVHNFFFSEEGK
jgi:hypothetical protein